MQPSKKSHLLSSQGHNSGSNSSMTGEPASEELLKLLAEKRKELEEVTQINRASADLANYFKDLSDNVNNLSTGAKDVSDILKNWNEAFIIMGLTNKDNKKQNELFRFVKE